MKEDEEGEDVEVDSSVRTAIEIMLENAGGRHNQQLLECASASSLGLIQRPGPPFYAACLSS